MAYFRCGGGGIPSSLKSGMNDVLNKKFGTSTTYPPTEWPDTVNLMGPLPEKTVSGAIASFADGADDVPLKSASFVIVASGGNGTPSTPVPIVGKSSVTVKQTGKNVCDFTSDVRTDNRGLYFTANADGSIRYYGTTTATYSYITNTISCDLRAGVTYTFSRDTAQSHRMFLNCTADDGTSANYIIASNSTSVTFTPTKNLVSFRLELASLTNGGTYDVTVYPMCEVGSTATTFQKYKSKTPITVSLGQTVYGGTLAEDGTLTISFAYTEFKDLTWQKHSTAQNTYFADVPTAKTGTASTKVNAICSAYSVVTRNNQTGQTINYSISASNVNGGRFFVLDDSYTTLEEFQEATKNYQLAYELATPIVVTGLDEISVNTYLGDNNIWCDSGDSEVTYRADIALALGQ